MNYTTHYIIVSFFVSTVLCHFTYHFFELLHCVTEDVVQSLVFRNRGAWNAS